MWIEFKRNLHEHIVKVLYLQRAIDNNEDKQLMRIMIFSFCLTLANKDR